MTIHKGGCHCGQVRFEVELSADIEVNECNCSICCLTGYLHLIVCKDSFKLASGQDELSTYQFNTNIAKHFFCANCGIKSFYIPRSNPDGYSVNARCLDPETVTSMTINSFDGRNWKNHADKLRHLTQ